jgi:hypothetical protein
MAKTTKTRAAVTTPEETAVEKQLEALAKQIGDKEPTTAQKEQRTKLRDQLGSLRFARIANKRIPKTLKAIQQIANLSGPNYRSNEAQVTAIVEALTQAVANVKSKLSGTKEKASGFVLPGAGA